MRWIPRVLGIAAVSVFLSETAILDTPAILVLPILTLNGHVIGDMIIFRETEDKFVLALLSLRLPRRNTLPD